MKLSEPNQRALGKRQREVSQRLERSFGSAPTRPVIEGGNVHYEVSARAEAIACGGIGVMSQVVDRVGLREAIDSKVTVLRRHLPYHESDHVLTVAYNILSGGSRLEDLEGMRQNVGLLAALGAPRLPDPTTCGDFTRRFEAADILNLMESLNQTRCGVWLAHRDAARCRSQAGARGPRLQGQQCFGEAVIDVDGTIAETTGECKAGMGLSYQKTWGYGPLLISLANTKEPLYLVNRGANEASQSEAAPWLERAITLVSPHAKRICLRGDTAFALTSKFDDWSARGIDFVMGYDAHPNLKTLADALPIKAWKELERPARYEVATQPRQRPHNAKEEFVRAHSYRSQRLAGEQVAEFAYRPGKCKQPYRMIVVRKNLNVTKGQEKLLDEVRYFFYVTNRTDLSPAEVVWFNNDRGDQENLIEQLKNGVHAMTMPAQDLLSNWAYMVMAAAAWSLKAWYGLLLPNRKLGEEVVRMDFKRFLQAFIMVPCQIARSGRRLIYRVLGYAPHLAAWLTFSKHLQATRLLYRPTRC